MSNNTKKFGTFEGVFTPTILTILGVIMYLRLGWVVGKAGFGGALIIILLANVVTMTTGLSLASIATNIRIGTGGLYALISRSLGLEVGSAIGIPLYISQTLSAALYITGFTEGWLSIFPEHNAIIISSIVLLTLLIVSLISTSLALKVQYLIMTILVLSLISFFLGKNDVPREIILMGDLSDTTFWKVFAIFFPAVTGISAGAAMSGDLKNSRKSLPRGILPGIGITMLLYIGVAYWFDYMATSKQLVENYAIMINLSRWPILIIGGILGATLSSALGSIIGSPRTLVALGRDKVIPFSTSFARLSKKGEPYFALIFTIVIVEFCLLLGNLNTLAPLLTMFFLITYAVVNLAVAIEKGINIPSFRPTFNIPLFVPVVGFFWTVFIMFLVNPIFALIALIFILVFYIYQVKKGIQAPWGDVRSGFFLALSEWAAKISINLPKNAKSWKPNLLIPIEDPQNMKTLNKFIRDISYPSGTLRFFSIKISETLTNEIPDPFSNENISDSNPQEKMEIKKLQDQLESFVSPLKSEGIFTVSTIIRCNDFFQGLNTVTQVSKGMFFPPNIMFLTMSKDPFKNKKLEQIVNIASSEHLGLCILSQHGKNNFDNHKIINVWLRRGSPNSHLALLIALQLKKNWEGQIRLILVINDETNRTAGTKFLAKMAEKARLPIDSEKLILSGEFKDILKNTITGDLNIFGMTARVKGFTMQEITGISTASCIFVKDSGEESIMA